MSYFPFFVEIRDKKCLVAGGGIVALEGVDGDAHLADGGAGAEQLLLPGQKGAVGGDHHLELQLMGDVQ